MGAKFRLWVELVKKPTRTNPVGFWKTSFGEVNLLVKRFLGDSHIDHF